MSERTETPPICTKCKHYEKTWGGDMCARAVKVVGIDPVTGSPVRQGWVFPYSERTSWFPWRCGPKGKHFASKS